MALDAMSKPALPVKSTPRGPMVEINPPFGDGDWLMPPLVASVSFVGPTAYSVVRFETASPVSNLRSYETPDRALPAGLMSVSLVGASARAPLFASARKLSSRLLRTGGRSVVGLNETS